MRKTLRRELNPKATLVKRAQAAGVIQRAWKIEVRVKMRKLVV